ncbi:MAG: hypothetical protein OXI90_08360 [Gammaproteobacteria bacterium]|nr:hypothetical protein [Gammaproteobacteria bacterium]
MMSSPDTAPRGGRGTSSVFGAWASTLRPAIGVLGCFLPDVWLVFFVLLIWLFMAILFPSFAGSNAMLLFTVGSLACLVGSRVGRLAAWSGGILVPRYTGTLFVLCVAGVVLPTLLAGLACRYLGNAVPAVAPAMLLGAVVTRLGIRRPDPWAFVGVFVLIWSCGMVWGVGSLVDLALATSVLSHAWIQLPALIGTGLIVPVVYRTLRTSARTTTVVGLAVRSPIGFSNSLREDLRDGALIAVPMLGFLSLGWYFSPDIAENLFVFFWLVPLGTVIFTWWQSVAHVQLSRSWIFGIALDRNDLGRRAAAGVVWMSLPALVLGAGWSGIHALTTASGEAIFLKEILLSQIAVLLVATSLCQLTRRLPPSFFGHSCIFAVFLGLGGGLCWYFTYHDHATSYAMLILALIGAALLTVFVGGWALARAEILSEGYSPPGWRSRANKTGRGLR